MVRVRFLSRYIPRPQKTQPDIPLEIKILVIRELSPSQSSIPARQSEDENAAYFYFRDLRAVCLVWPDTIAIIRKILFENISLRANDQDIDASLHNLCQALENDPGLPTFIRTLEFSHQGIDEESLFIPTASRPLFLSFLSFIPGMHKLESFRLDNMYFHEETSTQFLDDLSVLKESSLRQLILSNNAFSISAFNALFDHWYDTELKQVSVDAISLLPPDSNGPFDRMLLDLDEDTWDWDDENTWEEWEVDQPRSASSCYVDVLRLTLSRFPVSGMLMLMDLLASHKWSPLACVDMLEIAVEDFSSLAMTNTLVTRINNLIRRYEFSCLSLSNYTVFEDTVDAPLHLAGLQSGSVRLTLVERFTLLGSAKDLFRWYVKSLGAVPPNSRLRKFFMELAVIVPLKEMDLGSQGVWGEMDTALSGENLQLETLIIDVFLLPPYVEQPIYAAAPNGAKTVALAHLRTWLMEICLPKVTAKYFGRKMEQTEEDETSALHFWIGNEPVDAY